MTTQRLTILILSRLYGGVSGGVERMSIALANAMADRGHAVYLLSWDKADATTFFPLDNRVTWHKLDLGDANVRASLHLRLKRFRMIRRLVRQIEPDVAVGFQQGTFWNALVGTVGRQIPVVAAERNSPNRFDHLKAGKKRDCLFQTFRLATRITVQFPEYADGYPPYLRDRIVAIENPVMLADGCAAPAGTPGDRKTLLSVGRLTYQKNPHLLIEAFSRIADRHLDWTLRLVGNGQSEDELRALVRHLGLEARVVFAGAVKDTSAQYRAAHLFCLASRFEGFPNAVAEAMAHGLPCVGYADCAGMPQLIRDGETGILAAGNGDPYTLAAALDRMMADDAGREALGAQARASMAQYEPALIFERWEALFQGLAR